MASCGFCARVRRGVTYRSAMGLGQPLPGGFTTGRKIGVWQQVLTALQAKADAEGKLNWDIHFVDGSVIRAHQHAAGAKREI